MLVSATTALAAGVVGAVRHWFRGASDTTTPQHEQRRHLRIHHCSRCDHPFFDPEREPDAWWFVLCPRCLNDTRRALLLLIALYLLVGLVVLLLSAGL